MSWEFATGIICSNNPINFTDPLGLCAKGQDKPWWEKITDVLIPTVYGIESPNPRGPIKEKVRTYTWPYSWQGWVGLTLGLTGGTLILKGVIVPGIVIFAIGGGFTIWDLVAGISEAEETGKAVGEMWIEKDKEDWKEIEEEFKIQDRIRRE